MIRGGCRARGWGRCSGRRVGPVGVEIGGNEWTGGNRARQYRKAHPEKFSAQSKAPISWEGHQPALAELAKLKQDVEFLGKVSAFFAAKQR